MENNRGIKRTPTERQDQRRQIAAMYLQGKSQWEIAQVFGLTQETISGDLKAIREAWKQSSIKDFSEAVSQELAKIDHLELTYWEAWNRSLEAVQRKQQTAKNGEDGRPIPVKAVVLSYNQNGDPRFLEGVERCIKKRCELLGLNAPVKTEITGKDGEPFKVYLVDTSDI